MTRERVVELLEQHGMELSAEYGIASLSLFGSVARGEARPGSDVDVLVDFPGPPTFAQYMGLKFRLEDLLGVSVDLVTRAALRPRIRPQVEAEAVRVT
jgi:uncharacterized protein